MGLFGPNPEKLKKKGDVEGLVQLALGDEWKARDEAIEALGDLGAVDALVRVALGDDIFAGPRAVELLRESGGPRALDLLAGALDQGDPVVRRRAAVALGRLGARGALEALLSALKDSDGHVREEAAKALGEIGDPRSAEALIAALADEWEVVTAHAAAALGKLGDRRAIEPLVGLVATVVPAGEYAASSKNFPRRWAINALRDIGGPEVEQALARIGLAAIARWPWLKDRGVCDICGAEVGPVWSALVPSGEFQELVNRGYDPFTRGRRAADSTVGPLRGAEPLAGVAWGLAVSADTTDWGLCLDCAEDLARFAGELADRADAEGEVDRTGDRVGAASEIVSGTAFADLVSAGDVEGLRRLFSLAGDWDTRETVMVGFRELFYGHHQSSDEVRARLRAVLPDILALCKAETSGGSYRDNCIRTAEDLIAGLGGAPDIGRAAADPRTNSVIVAVGEWMDQAAIADRDIAHEVLYASWGDWGTGSRSEVIDVLERCIARDMLEDDRVEFSASVPDKKLGDFDVTHAPEGPSENFERYALYVRAGNPYHYLVRVGPDRFAIRVHGGGVQDLAGVAKEW